MYNDQDMIQDHRFELTMLIATSLQGQESQLQFAHLVFSIG